MSVLARAILSLALLLLTGCCSKCLSGKAVVPIMYGLPLGEALEQADRGEIKCGGCCVSPWAPKWHCKACNRDF